jgi:hypothetical protein
LRLNGADKSQFWRLTWYCNIKNDLDQRLLAVWLLIW